MFIVHKIYCILFCRIMRTILLIFSCYLGYGSCKLWPNGIVHYAINTKDYDVHSQNEIISALTQIQNEICVKFFHLTTNDMRTEGRKVLYINNPDKRKDCPPDNYDFKRNVIDMIIGYRCLNAKDIARITLAMLRASTDQTVSTINSYDLVKKFREHQETLHQSPGLLSLRDRNYINAHYQAECGGLSKPETRRGGGNDSASADYLKYYEGSLWPLGIVMYAVSGDVGLSDSNLKIINQAMTTIELASCVVFQKLVDQDDLAPKNFLWFSNEGEEMPNLGFKEGNQTLKLAEMAQGVPGHTGHALNMLMRVLGVPMMSNRHDRDNYITVNWNRVQKGKENYLEKMPRAAWLTHIPYDFTSATHAPANYLCNDCQSPTEYQTVTPIQDRLWQRTMSMGHRVDLSDSDKEILSTLYGKYCQDRFIGDQ